MDNKLEHVGVLGMKWGIRRGESKGISTKTTQKKTLSEEEIKQQRIVVAKKALIVGSAAVATGLAVYGTYKISKYVKGHSQEIKAIKELVQLTTSKGKSSKGNVPQASTKSMNQVKKYTDAEWTKKKAEMLKEIKEERLQKPISPEVRARVRKEMLKNDPIYRELIKEQVEWEAIYGPPTPKEMEQAKQSLMREGVKFLS